MNYFCDVKVGDIRIIVKKQERGDFIFSNDSRISSGFVCFLEGEGSLTIDGVGQFDTRPGSFVRYEKGDRYKINVGPSSLYYTSEIDIDVSSEFDFPRHVLCTEDELSSLERIWRVWSEQGEYCFVEARILLLRLFLGLSRRIRSIPQRQLGAPQLRARVHPPPRKRELQSIRRCGILQRERVLSAQQLS